MNHKEILFDWDGQPVKKTFAELAAAKATVPASAYSDTQHPAPAATPAPAAATTAIGAKAGPGVEMGNGSKGCVAGDATPVGTVQDGMRKVTTKTPFGEICRWEPVK